MIVATSAADMMDGAAHTFFCRRSYNIKAQEFNMLEGMSADTAGEPQEPQGGQQEPAPGPRAGAPDATARAAEESPRTQPKARRNELKERVVALEHDVASMKAQLALLAPLLGRVRVLEAHAGIGDGAEV